MSRRCDLTGKGVLTGNNVSHAHNKTRRRFLPNVQKMTVYSEAMGPVSLKLSTSALRMIERKGGIDPFLTETPASRLAPEGRKLKRRLKKIQDKASAA